ncbi:transposase, partial [Gluconobacter sp. LMG 31484]
PNPKAMLADRGYDSDSFRHELLVHGILPVIPSRKGRIVSQKTDWQRYRGRNRIERMFNRLNQMRRIATRYDKTALSFNSFLNIAAAKLWIGSFVNVT